MMTSSEESVARRARVQCERHGWPTGTRVGVGPNHTPAIVVAPETVAGHGPAIAWVCNYYEAADERLITTTWPGRDLLPVPDDPATIGCFAAMARRVLGEPRAFASCDEDPIGTTPEQWRVWPTGYDHYNLLEAMCDDSLGTGATELEAWLAALEAAP